MEDDDEITAGVYEKRVVYEFRVNGQRLGLEDLGEGFWSVEDLRKNGQEDSHMRETVCRCDHGVVWHLEDADYNSFVEYKSHTQARAILDFLNLNGFPETADVQTSTNETKETE